MIPEPSLEEETTSRPSHWQFLQQITMILVPMASGIFAAAPGHIEVAANVQPNRHRITSLTH